MSRTLYTEDGDPVLVPDDLPAEPERTNSEWAQLRQAKSAEERATREAAEAKRETAFLRAGLDLDDPKVSDFYKAYDGDATVEAIKAAATTRGYLATPDAEADMSEIDVAAVAANQRISSASAGATPDLRSDTVQAQEAFEAGGAEALSDFLRSKGFPIVADGQT